MVLGSRIGVLGSRFGVLGSGRHVLGCGRWALGSQCRPLPAVTALLFKMEEANLASRAKAQELLHATNQVGLPHRNPAP